METTEFQVDLCVLVIATCSKKLGLNFGKKLPTEREFGNFVDRYAVAVMKGPSDYVPSEFENLFRSDPACYVAKYFKYKHCKKDPREERKILRDELSHEIKIVTDFNVVNSTRHGNKVLTLKTYYMVLCSY